MNSKSKIILKGLKEEKTGKDEKQRKNWKMNSWDGEERNGRRGGRDKEFKFFQIELGWKSKEVKG